MSLYPKIGSNWNVHQQGNEWTNYGVFIYNRKLFHNKKEKNKLLRPEVIWMNLKNMMLKKQNKIQKSVWFNLQKALEKAKLSYVDRIRPVVASVESLKLDLERHVRTSCGNRNDLWLDRRKHVCQTHQTVHLRHVRFTLCKVHLN